MHESKKKFGVIKHICQKQGEKNMKCVPKIVKRPRENTSTKSKAAEKAHFKNARNRNESHTNTFTEKLKRKKI